VVDLHAPFFHHLLELAVADRIRHIPAHAPENDLSLKMTAFEIDHREAPATKPLRIIGAAGNRAQVCDRTEIWARFSQLCCNRYEHLRIEPKYQAALCPILWS
jgi:hypothetical protein